MIYTVINQKGGVAKSTTAQSLAAGLALKGYKTLAIDLDGQRNLTFAYKGNADGLTSLNLLTGTAAAQTIQETEGGALIAGSKSLTAAESLLTGTGKEYRLKEALEPIKSLYDFIIIDTPPALSILTINALTAADRAIIPTQADIYSVQGIGQVYDTIKAVKKYCNPALIIDGILITRYSPRATLSREVAKHIERTAAEIGTKVYKTKIREAIAVKEAQLKQTSIFAYAPASNVAGDYQAFIEEVLKNASF